MRLLISNDDGIHARGITVLADVCRTLGDVTVVAPDREQSGASHSLTLQRPLRPVRRPDGAYQVDGTPTDCVLLALGALLDHKPDYVLSGINHGPNMGEDVLYSGTVAAAMEGLSVGIPGVALSFAGGELELLDSQRPWIERLVRDILDIREFPQETLLNINLPPIPGAEIRGIRVTTLGNRVFSGSLVQTKDPWGREVFWIGGGQISWSGREDSDFRAVRDGFISVTPLHVDLTNYALLEAVDGVAARTGVKGGADGFGGYRARLVEDLRARGIRDLAVLRAFGEVPRHRFVPDALTRQAYEDTSLPIGHGQTISQPSTQAVYLEALALTGHERVLEIGTGSGYQAALLALLAEDVVSVERVGALARRAKQALAAAGVRNVLVITGDGTVGWRPLAPYHAVVVAAAGPAVPAPLLEQVADGGRLVAPVSRGGAQVLIRLTRRGDAFEQEELGPAQFVPLIGRHGFSGDRESTGGPGS